MIQFDKKLKTARNDLFTFVIHCDVPSTNNDVENFIQRYIMQRNVRGCNQGNENVILLVLRHGG